MPSAISSPTIDVRSVSPHERHPLVFSTFHSLAAGDAMELVNVHDPVPLHAQFAARQPGRFGWEYLESGPELWRVRITKRAPSHAAGQCCGSCGGA